MLQNIILTTAKKNKYVLKIVFILKWNGGGGFQIYNYKIYIYTFFFYKHTSGDN